MLKKVFTAEHISEAGMIRSYLEQHNIPSQLRNEYASSVIGELPFMTSSPEIWVDESTSQAAAELLFQLQQPDTNSSEWVCSDCDELNPGNFHSCWRCQTSQA